MISPVGSLAINVFFGVLMFLLAFNILLVCIYVCCNASCQCARILSHIIWWIFSPIMILTFVLGAAVGVVGLVGTDGSGVFRYIFSKQNLLTDKVIITGDSALYLNTCFNGNIYFYILITLISLITRITTNIEDGNLAATLGLETGDIGGINNLSLASYLVKNITYNNTLNNATTVPVTVNYMDQMNNDIRLTYPTTDQNSPTYQFNQWLKYTDSTVL